MEIVNYEKFKTWKARLVGFRVGAKVVFGKMLWLIEHQNELNLDLANAAKMAFGSEYLKERKLPISDDLLKAVMEDNVDTHVTEALIPQDKDSTMTDIAGDKLLETIRNYFDEEVHEKSNRKEN